MFRYQFGKLTANRPVERCIRGSSNGQLGADCGETLRRPAESVGDHLVHIVHRARHGDDEAVVAALVQSGCPVAAAERCLCDPHHTGTRDGEVSGRVGRKPTDGASVGLAPDGRWEKCRAGQGWADTRETWARPCGARRRRQTPT